MTDAMIAIALISLGITLLLLTLFWFSDESWETKMGATVVIILIALIVSCLTVDGVAAWGARRQKQTCRLHGGDPDRLLFDTQVVCLPRYRGSDSLHLTVPQ